MYDLEEFAEAIHEMEKQALNFPYHANAAAYHAVLNLMSAERETRQAIIALLAKQYQDGTCDGFAVYDFARVVYEAWERALPDDAAQRGEQKC